MSLFPYANLKLSLSSFSTAFDQGTQLTLGELFNISVLDPLLPTFLLAALSLSVLLFLTYHSLSLTCEIPGLS